MQRKIVYIILIILFCNHLSMAQSGCVIGGKLYYDPNYTEYSVLGIGVKRFYDPTMFLDVFTMCGMSDNKSYAKVGSRTTSYAVGIFPVDIQCNTGKPGSWTTSAPGYVYNYSIVQCSLDDSSWMLVFGLSVLGGIVIRKNKR